MNKGICEDIKNIVPIPRKTRLFVLDKLREQGIKTKVYSYDTFQGNSNLQPHCEHGGRGYWNGDIVFIESELTQDELFNLIKKIEDERNCSF